MNEVVLWAGMKVCECLGLPSHRVHMCRETRPEDTYQAAEGTTRGRPPEGHLAFCSDTYTSPAASPTSP